MTTKQRKIDTVDVLEADRPLYGYVPGPDGQFAKKQLGVLTRHEFDGENVNRLFFSPTQAMSEFGRKEQFQVGTVSDQFKIVDHASVLQPLIALGYTITKMYYARGGLKMQAVLQPPHPLAAADPVRWDLNHWHSPDNGILTEHLFLSVSMKPGIGIHVKRGWFRQICTNGLVATILSLGEAIFSHRNWSAESMKKAIAVDFPEIDRDNVKAIRGPLIGNTAGLQRFGGLLTAESEAPIPFFVKDELSTFDRTPEWLRTQVSLQIAHFAEAHPPKTAVYALDVVNLWTSAINQRPETEANPFRPLAAMDHSVTSMAKLVGGFSL